MECDQVASPTLSITASTFPGKRAPDSKASVAPIDFAYSRFASSREVTQVTKPAAFAS